MNARIALVDDHILVRRGLGNLVRSLDKYDILFEADNGRDFIDKIRPENLPDIVLMDIMMPEMDGYDTTQWIKNNHPQIKVLALSQMDKELPIIRMIRAGAKGFLPKDCEIWDLGQALNSLLSTGFYCSETVSGRLIRNINTTNEEVSDLTESQIEFLKLACSELTYKEIE